MTTIMSLVSNYQYLIGFYIRWMLRQLFLMVRLRKNNTVICYEMLRCMGGITMSVGWRRSFMGWSRHHMHGIHRLISTYNAWPSLRLLQIPICINCLIKSNLLILVFNVDDLNLIGSSIKLINGARRNWQVNLTW